MIIYRIGNNIIRQQGVGSVWRQPSATADFYISPSGSDSNPGTLGSPWAITAINTKQATYRGKTVGLLDGTYNVYSLIQAGSNDGFVPALQIDGGTVGSPTVIKSINPRQAILECRSGGVTYPTVNTPVIGQNTAPHMGYVTIDGILTQGFGSKGIYLGAYLGNTTSPYAGYTIQNCEFTAQNCAGFASGNNFSCVEVASANSLQILNNYFHNNSGNVAAKDGNHYTSTLMWETNGSLYEHNTIIDSPGFYGKEDGNTASIVRYNYVDTTGWSNTDGIQDFAGQFSSATGNTTQFYGNILIAPQAIDFRATHPLSWANQDTVQIFNNTLVVLNVGQPLGICGTVSNSGLLSCHDNIVYSQATGDMDLVCVNVQAPGTLDYDLYYSTVATYIYGTFSNALDSVRNNTSSFSTWQARFSAAPEINSIIGSDPLFTNSGARALAYQLQGGSPAKGSGTGGVDRGAWGGSSPPSQIGCNF